jgi:hypothetical protein
MMSDLLDTQLEDIEQPTPPTTFTIESDRLHSRLSLQADALLASERTQRLSAVFEDYKGEEDMSGEASLAGKEEASVLREEQVSEDQAATLDAAIVPAISLIDKMNTLKHKVSLTRTQEPPK